MKKLQTLLFQLFLGILLTAASCNKNNEEPKHKNIVTATINGKPWKAGCEEGPLFGCHIADLQYYPNIGIIELATSNITRDTGLQFTIWDMHEPGIYRIRDKQQCGIIVKEEPCGRQGHYIDESDLQEIEIISIDNEKKIIEGRFQYIGRDTNCLSEPVHITNGFFKVKYRP